MAVSVAEAAALGHGLALDSLFRLVYRMLPPNLAARQRAERGTPMLPSETAELQPQTRQAASTDATCECRFVSQQGTERYAHAVLVWLAPCCCSICSPVTGSPVRQRTAIEQDTKGPR